jgi:hypothetical protein
MSAWLGNHFARPYLAASIVEGTAGEVILSDAHRSMALCIDGDIQAAVGCLNELRTPLSEMWAHVKSERSPPLTELVTNLDKLGWLREEELSTASSAGTVFDRLDRLVERGQKWLGPDLINSPASTAEGLASIALARCRRAWKHCSPLVSDVLARIFHKQTIAQVSWDPMSTAICEFGEIESQTWTALQLFAMSDQAGTSRYSTFQPTGPCGGAALNVLMDAERHVRTLLERLGEPTIYSMAQMRNGAEMVAPAIYQHRWYQTNRYCECVAGLLRFRLRRDLRELVVRYLREEMGHEAYELRMCRTLGIPNMDRFAPLAFFGAYPELLQDSVDRSPLSFLLSITLAEGLPGDGKRLTELLGESGVDPLASAHDELDKQLNHEFVTRRLFSCIGTVSESIAVDAISDLLFLTEVAHEGWEMLTRYVQAGLPKVIEPFCITRSELKQLCNSK